MSPITAAYYEEVGGSFFACPCFFQVTMMKFLIDLKEDKATGGYTVLLLTLNSIVPYTVSFSLFDIAWRQTLSVQLPLQDFFHALGFKYNSHLPCTHFFLADFSLLCSAAAVG